MEKISSKLKKVIHVSTVHHRFDTRIFIKMCSYFSNKGYDVHLFVADGLGFESVNGIKIHDIGKPFNRLHRIFIKTHYMFYHCIKNRNAIFHLHDPELLLLGLFLKLINQKVIFDSHEDIPKSIFSKSYLNLYFQTILSFSVSAFLKMLLPSFNVVISATHSIKKSLQNYNNNLYTINNYPIIDELSINRNTQKLNRICYVGTISIERGIVELILSLNLCKNDITLDLVGHINVELLDKLTKLPGWSKVCYHGFCNRHSLSEILAMSSAGIVTFHDLPNHINSQPNKLFEYMSASKPVICSDFPLWRKLIVKHKCGILVNPTDPKSIANAIDCLVSNNKLSSQLGINGKNAILGYYNWEKEFNKLENLYTSLNEY